MNIYLCSKSGLLVPGLLCTVERGLWIRCKETIWGYKRGACGGENEGNRVCHGYIMWKAKAVI